MDLGSIGVWSGALRRGEDRGAIVAATKELEQLGYSTIWFPGGDRAGLEELITAMLQATSRVKVATGIISIWTHPAADTAAMYHRINRA